ncbi:centrosomal protein 43 isoform X2 [Protopterus annectens]|uniref:centrosomal protein 43 isoform X2 n=1 Tax=Protopterus annectens TaxID=7888 RepID=UPI001CFBE324|nr:centrosomal protein 43 isoform X2 [Protopterus annectens]
MSATEEDTELRDLLVQTLENNGVLNKIKAELRAAVFLALEEQEKVQNKTPLVNEQLKRFLNTKDGSLASSLIVEFLQFFNLDFTLAVYQPETNTVSRLEDRKILARDLRIFETEGSKGAPLLVELIKRQQQKDKDLSTEDDHPSISQELSSKQITEVKKLFDMLDKDKSGKISKDDVKLLFMDLLPHFHRSMLETYVTDEFKTVDKATVEFIEVLGLYKRLFLHCRSVVVPDVSEKAAPWKPLEGKLNTQNSLSKDEEIPRYKGHVKESREMTEVQKAFEINSPVVSSTEERNRSAIYSSIGDEPNLDTKLADKTLSVKHGKSFNFDEDVDEDEGDSFFDDPLPKQNKIYSWNADKNSDTDEDAEDSLREINHRLSPVDRMTESKKPAGSYSESKKPAGNLTSLSDAPALKTGSGSLTGMPLSKEPNRLGKTAEMKELKTINDKISRLELGDEDDDYDDDFNSASHRSDKTKSEISIGEEIEEEISEGEDLFKVVDLTQDRTISQLSDVADYIEEVSQS